MEAGALASSLSVRIIKGSLKPALPLWVAKTSSAPKSLICSDLRPSCHPLFLVPWPGPTPREQQFARHRPGFHERSAQACFCSFHEGSEAVRAERSQFSDGIRALRSLRPERRTGSGPHSEAGLDLALPSGSWPVRSEEHT